MLRTFAVLLVAAASTACLRSTTVVSIRPDGSGTIVQESGLSPQAMAMLKGLAESGSGETRPTTGLFDEEQARKMADSMGVRFLSGEPIKTDAVEGYRARFEFDDVRKLQMNMSQKAAARLGAQDAGGDPPFGFGFERKGDSAVLTITMPEEKPSELAGIKEDMTPEQNAQAVQMMKMMMQGLYVDISLEFDGRIVRTTAPNMEGSRLTLLQLDFDKLLADATALEKLQDAKDIQGLRDIPGLKVLTERQVTVEFTK